MNLVQLGADVHQHLRRDGCGQNERNFWKEGEGLEINKKIPLGFLLVRAK